MDSKKEKEITLEEMQEKCLKCAYEIARLESLKNIHLKSFDELNYEIYKLKKNQDESKLPANSKDS